MVHNSPDVVIFSPEEEEEYNRQLTEKTEKHQEAKKKEQEAKKKEQEVKKKEREDAQDTVAKEPASTENELSADTASMMTTAEVPLSAPSAAVSHDIMPTGVVLAVCAALLICIGAAWFYRTRRS